MLSRQIKTRQEQGWEGPGIREHEAQENPGPHHHPDYTVNEHGSVPACTERYWTEQTRLAADLGIQTW